MHERIEQALLQRGVLDKLERSLLVELIKEELHTS